MSRQRIARAQPGGRTTDHPRIRFGRNHGPGEKPGSCPGARRSLKRRQRGVVWLRDVPTSKHGTGRVIEQDAIDLYNEVHFTDYVEYRERAVRRHPDREGRFRRQLTS